MLTFLPVNVFIWKLQNDLIFHILLSILKEISKKYTILKLKIYKIIKYIEENAIDFLRSI